MSVIRFLGFQRFLRFGERVLDRFFRFLYLSSRNFARLMVNRSNDLEEHAALEGNRQKTPAFNPITTEVR